MLSVSLAIACTWCACLHVQLVEYTGLQVRYGDRQMRLVEAVRPMEFELPSTLRTILLPTFPSFVLCLLDPPEGEHQVVQKQQRRPPHAHTHTAPSSLQNHAHTQNTYTPTQTTQGHTPLCTPLFPSPTHFFVSAAGGADQGGLGRRAPHRIFPVWAGCQRLSRKVSLVSRRHSCAPPARYTQGCGPGGGVRDRPPPQRRRQRRLGAVCGNGLEGGRPSADRRRGRAWTRAQRCRLVLLSHRVPLQPRRQSSGLSAG